MATTPKVSSRLYGPVHLEPTEERWTRFNRLGATPISRLWADKPDRVFVFKDSKLRTADCELVMLRKEVFDTILGTLRDLVTGRSALEVTLSQTQTSITTLLEHDAETPSDVRRDVLRRVEEDLRSVRVRIMPANTPRTLDASSTDPEVQQFDDEHGSDWGEDDDT